MENLNEILMKIKNDIGFIKGKLEEIDKRLEKINGNLIHHDKKIDVLENDCSKLQEAFKPVKDAFNKLTFFSFGAIALLGSVLFSLAYFLKGKLGL